MGFSKTFFPYFKNYCIDKFGSDLGGLIFSGAENELSVLMKDANYRNSKYIRWHMDKNMLPAISIYQTFKQLDSTSERAYEYTDEVLQIFRLKNKKRNQLIGSLPFGYFAFKVFCKNDDVVLAGYKPAIVFERNETIAKGNNRCDFHFKNGMCS